MTTIQVNDSTMEVPEGIDPEAAKQVLEAVAEMAKPLTQQEIDETRERVSLVRARLLEWTPFFGHLCLKMRVVISKIVPTAAVTPDAKMIINPRFAKDLTNAELAGLICHEVMHPAFQVFERRQDRDMKLWNVAHDYAINWIIQEMTNKSGKSGDNAIVKLPEGGLLSDKYAEKDDHGHITGYMSAEEIYNQLLEEGPGGEGEGEDEGQGGIGQDCRPDLADDPNPSDIERKRREDFWKVAVVEAAQVNEQSRNRGNLPSNLLKLIKDIVEPRVDWPMALARWVGENGKRSDYTYRRPSRRSEAAGAILPSLKKHGVADVIVLWDTSGSMNGREEEILGEVIGICRDLDMTLRVVCCDMGICSDTPGVEEYDDIKDEIKGGGGSDFRPAFDLFREEGWDGVIVAFTDGMIGVPAEMPECLRGTLWVLNEGEEPPTNAWGDVIKIGPDGKVSSGSSAYN
jgi:predicted metal-dependent peptidase